MHDPETEVDLTILWDVWRRLQTNYIEPKELKINDMVYGAVHGAVDAIGDPYTVFMTPTENRDFQSALNGHLEGIGAELSLKEGSITVVAPIKGSPAARAGLLPNDIITKVDHQNIEGLRLDEVVSKIRGKKGTSVVLTLYRDGEVEPIDLSIVRDSIQIPSVDSSIIETSSGSIALIALNFFGDDSVSEMRKAVNAIDQKQVKGVILDLRFNGGGLLDAAVDITSMFLKSGKVVEVERRDAPLETHFVNGQPILPTLPMVVLINEGSASASEIVAGALQDNKRATIVGTQSFGKGTVQEVLDLPGGASLRVTVARWLTPNGLNLGKKGVTPDIVSKRTTEDYENDRDPQLEKAEEVLLK
jgi:carboxyl-terminal processing protease